MAALHFSALLKAGVKFVWCQEGGFGRKVKMSKVYNK